MLRRINTTTNRIIVSIVLILLICIAIMSLSGCGFNKTVIDVNYKFNKAIIKDIGTVEVSSWKDYTDSDMVQVIDKNGNVYYTHSSNVILIYE